MAYGKIKKKKFPETRNLIEPNWIWIIIAWSVANFCCCVVSKSRWSLSQDNFNMGPYWKTYLQYSNLRSANNLKENLTRMYRSLMVQLLCNFFYRKSKMAVITGQIRHSSRNLWELYFKIKCVLYSYLKPMCLWWSFTKCIFFVLIR